MTSRTTKKAARAYQRTHGVPYAEARRRVMESRGDAQESAVWDPPGDEILESRPSAAVVGGIGIGRSTRFVVGRSNSGEADVEWNPCEGFLGVFGRLGSGKSSLSTKLLEQVPDGPSPILIIANNGPYVPDPVIHREVDRVQLTDLLVEGAPDMGKISRMTENAPLVVLDAVNQTPEDRAVLGALRRIAPFVAFTSPTVPEADSIGPASTEKWLLDSCSVRVTLSNPGASSAVYPRRYQGILSAKGDSKPFVPLAPTEDQSTLLIDLMRDHE